MLVEWYRVVFTHIDSGVTEFRNEAFTGIEELLLASGVSEFRNEAFIQELLFLKKMFFWIESFSTSCRKRKNTRIVFYF